MRSRMSQEHAMRFRNIDVVVFDAMGVTFVEGDDVNPPIPFVRRVWLHERGRDSTAVPAGRV